MNTIKFIIVVSMVLLASNLLYHQVVNAQIESCVLQNLKTIVVIDLTCDNAMMDIVSYSEQGYEIKGIFNPLQQPQDAIIFMQKLGVVK